MKSSISNTVRMLFGSHQKLKQKAIQLVLNDCRIKFVTSTKYLGLHIDSNLNWSTHSEHVLKRIRSRTNTLLRLRLLPAKLMTKLYRAFISPVYEYCDIVWKPSSTYSDKLDNYYTRTMRKINASQTLHNTTPSVRRKFHLALQVFKISKRICPSYLNHTIRYATDVTNRDLRNPYRLYVPNLRTIFGRNSFYYQCTLIWNCLLPSLYECDSISNFKLRYKII